MKSFRKQLKIGEEEISLCVDRAIVCDVMTKFNVYFSNMLELVARAKDEKEEDKEKYLAEIANALREKKADFFLMSDYYEEEIAKYALPLLLQKAYPDLTQAQAKTKAKETLDKLESVNGIQAFSRLIYDFIVSGFTMTETVQPTVTISLE